MADNGPLAAKSKSDVRDAGNFLNGVIEPNVPNCIDGNGTGNPIFNPDLFTAAMWPSS